MSKFGNENFRPLHVRDCMLFERGNVKGFATKGGETGTNEVIAGNSNPGGFPDVPCVIGIYHNFGEATQPGNIRSLDVETLFDYAGSVQITSGQSIAAIRGGASIAAGTTILSGGYIYGVQGKVIAQGTINSGSAFCAALFGQYDTSGSSVVLTSGYNAPLVLDLGAISHLASSAVLDGQVTLNTTQCLINSVFKVIANASYFMDLSESNLTGNWVVNKTPQGTAAKTLKIKIGGTDYYILLSATAV